MTERRAPGDRRRLHKELMMTTKTLLAAATVAAALALGGTQAQAGVILSENFNSSAFLGAGFGFNHFSDRWANTRYHYPAASANGWTVSGTGVFVASNLDDPNGDQAILLNEFANSRISHALNGLIAGETYNVSFLYWGDNITGAEWGLGVDVGATNYASINGVDGAAGTNPGTTHNFSFVAGGSSTTLSFYEFSQSGASPIIDNVLVTGPSAAAVPEPAAWALMIGGFGLAGATLRRRRALAV